MTWSDPHVFTTLEQVDQSTLNTYVSDNLQHLYDNRFSAAQYGQAAQDTSGQLALTTNYQTWGSRPLAQTGKWIIFGGFRVRIWEGSDPVLVETQLTIGGTVQAGTAVVKGGPTGEIQCAQFWTHTATGTAGSAVLQSRYTGGSGGSVLGGHLTAWQVMAP